MGEVHERGCIDINVSIPRIYRQATGTCNLRRHRVGISGVLLCNELIVVTLDEEWAVPSGGDCGGVDARGVVNRSLKGVGLLGAGKLKDQRRPVNARRALERSARHVKHLRPKVDCWNAEPFVCSSRPCRVEWRRTGAIDTAGSGGAAGKPLRTLHRCLICGERSTPGDDRRSFPAHRCGVSNRRRAVGSKAERGSQRREKFVW